MLLIKALGFVIFQCPEHPAALDVVSVNNQIITCSKVAVLLDIRHSQITVLLFKVVLQIEIRIVLTLHDRVIDGCSVNGNPPRHILILQIQLLVFRKNILALADRHIFISGRFFFWLGVLHDLGNLRKGFGLLVYLLIMAVNLKAAKNRCS